MVAGVIPLKEVPQLVGNFHMGLVFSHVSHASKETYSKQLNLTLSATSNSVIEVFPVKKCTFCYIAQANWKSKCYYKHRDE